jgi:putative membrane protein
MMPNPRSGRQRTAVIALLGLLAGSILFSLIGMALLRVAPSAAARFGSLLPWFMKVPTWVYMVSLPALVFVLYLPLFGPRRSILALLWGTVIGMTAELVGTTTGYPFGPYAYTSFLDPKILGHVPYLIPLSWYAVSVVALDLATRLGRATLLRLVLAAFFMVLWDVGLDPAMGAGFPVWEWKVKGFFYSMPAINWVGWFITSMVIVWGYEYVVNIRFRETTAWTIPVWITNGMFPVGICAVTGLWTATLAGAVALAIPVVAARERQPRTRATEST